MVIVEDDPIARFALCSYLEAAGADVISAAAEAESGLRAVRNGLPDVVLVDLGLPDYPGTELIRQLADSAPVTKVLVVTASEAREDLVESLRAGATGYLVKSASPEQIVSATRAAAQGEAIITDEVARKLFEEVREGHGPTASLAGFPEQLTGREKEILRLVGEGKANSEIAAELFVSPNTVKNHVANILAKLQLENRIQAAVHAVRSGIA